MKKILGFLLALMLLLSLSNAAFATEGTLQNGDNYIELPYKAKEASEYTYTATQTGTLYIMTTAFNSSYKGGTWKDSMDTIDQDWGSTKLTVDGVELSGLYYGTVQVVEGQSYTFSWKHTFNGYYGWSATLNLSYTPELMPVMGTPEFPVVLEARDCPTTSIEIPAGETVYYQLYDFDGGSLVLTGGTASVSYSFMNPETMEMETRTYTAVNGVTTAPISAASAIVQITNLGDTATVFHIDCLLKEGIRKNPAELVMGENVAETNVEDYEGYFYTWTAPRSGKLTLSFPGEGWYYSIFNETTNEYLGGSTSADENPVNPVTVEVGKGETLLININSYNNVDYTIPGGDVTMIASVEYGHEYQVTDSRAATCCAGGYTTYTCSECGHSYTEETEINPKNHTALKQVADYMTPTCEDEGCRPTWQCDGCGGVYSNMQGTLETTLEEQIIPASGHAFTEWEDLGNGTRKHICSVCGYEEVEDTQCHHTNTQVSEIQAADCLNPGKEGDTVCTDCGEVLQEGAVIPALGHSFGDWTTVREATYEQEGLQQRSCGTCGETEEQVLPKLEQNPTEPVKPSQPSAPVESQPATSRPDTTDPEPHNGNGWIWILVAAAVVIVAAAAVLLMRKRK